MELSGTSSQQGSGKERKSKHALHALASLPHIHMVVLNIVPKNATAKTASGAVSCFTLRRSGLHIAQWLASVGTILAKIVARLLCVKRKRLADSAQLNAITISNAQLALLGISATDIGLSKSPLEHLMPRNGVLVRIGCLNTVMSCSKNWADRWLKTRMSTTSTEGAMTTAPKTLSCGNDHSQPVFVQRIITAPVAGVQSILS